MSGKPAKPSRPGTNKPHSSPNKPPNRPKGRGRAARMSNTGGPDRGPSNDGMLATIALILVCCLIAYFLGVTGIIKL
jgi:hypothetical protein